MSKISIEVGQRIRLARVAKNLNQLEVADQLGITAGAYAKIERGETDPSITRIFEIASVLKVAPISLIQDSAKEKAAIVSKKEFYELQSQVAGLTESLTKLTSPKEPLKKRVSKRNSK